MRTPQSRWAARAIGVVLVVALAPPASAAPQAEHGEAAIRAYVDEHPTIAWGDLATVSFEGRFDGDLRQSELDTRDLDWSGRRLGVSGTVSKHIDFEVSRELGVKRDPWRDAYVDTHWTTWLNARVGRFKTPFGAERLRSLGRQDFVSRSLASQVIAPGRDRGAMLHGRLANRVLGWEAGLFAGRGEVWERRSWLESTPAGRLTAARLVSRPFATRGKGSPVRSLRLAVAVTDGAREAGLGSVEGRTILDGELFTVPVFIAGRERRTGLEAQWTPGPVRIEGEWMRLRSSRNGQALSGADLPALTTHGWYTAAVWEVLRAGSKTRLYRPHWMRSLEVGVRLEGFDVDALAAPADATGPMPEELPAASHRALTFGVNYSAQQWLRVQVDAIHERLADTALMPHGNSTRRGVIARLQLVF